jgi:membrane-associated phospholipid phosphatase
MTLPIWAKNILFLLVYMISGLILAIIIEGLTSGSDLLPLNAAIESAMVAMRTPILTTFFVNFTSIANPFVFATAAVALAVFLVVKKDFYEAALFLVTLVVTVLSLTVLKNFLQISRPVSDIYAVEGWSFPSGHTTLATSFFFLLSYIFMDKMQTARQKWLLISISVVGIALAALSRLYLGAHWALDVLAGIALGLMSVSFTVIIFNLVFGEAKTLRRRINL